MHVDWLYQSAAVIAAVCANIAIVECLCGDEAFQGGLRLVCGVYAALAVVRLAADGIRMIL